MLISTSYLPPLHFFNKIHTKSVITLEIYEHFVKQTLRNRCHILSPNGVQTLIIPISHDHRQRAAIKDIRIANDQPWQRQHWRSLCAAYQRSAFFEFYQDDLAPFYEKNYEFLLDFNTELLRFLLQVLKLDIDIQFTESYEAPNHKKEDDFRDICNVSEPVSRNEIQAYPQVFEYKSGFQPGLSAADLVFNMGPASRSYLSSDSVNFKSPAEDQPE